MKVVVHVYDIIPYNKYIDCLGLGAYHTGTPFICWLILILRS